MSIKFSAGKHTYGEPEIRSFGSDAKCVCGDYTSIADGVVILVGGEHRTDTISTFPFRERGLSQDAESIGYSRGDVIIGNDVWIGANVMILSGVTIHDGAVIGAGSVVTRNVLPYWIVAGNPARYLRSRFSPRIVNELLCIEWWNWPEDKVRENAGMLSRTDVEAFIEKFWRST